MFWFENIKNKLLIRSFLPWPLRKCLYAFSQNYNKCIILKVLTKDKYEFHNISFLDFRRKYSRKFLLRMFCEWKLYKKVIYKESYKNILKTTMFLHAILTFLSFTIAFILRDWNFRNSKETEMLQKNFELALTKVKNNEILWNWLKLLSNIIYYFEILLTFSKFH